MAGAKTQVTVGACTWQCIVSLHGINMKAAPGFSASIPAASWGVALGPSAFSFQWSEDIALVLNPDPPPIFYYPSRYVYYDQEDNPLYDTTEIIPSTHDLTFTLSVEIPEAYLYRELITGGPSDAPTSTRQCTVSDELKIPAGATITNRINGVIVEEWTLADEYVFSSAPILVSFTLVPGAAESHTPPQAFTEDFNLAEVQFTGNTAKVLNWTGVDGFYAIKVVGGGYDSECIWCNGDASQLNLVAKAGVDNNFQATLLLTGNTYILDFSMLRLECGSEGVSYPGASSEFEDVLIHGPFYKVDGITAPYSPADAVEGDLVFLPLSWLQSQTNLPLNDFSHHNGSSWAACGQFLYRPTPSMGLLVTTASLIEKHILLETDVSTRTALFSPGGYDDNRFIWNAPFLNASDCESDPFNYITVTFDAPVSVDPGPSGARLTAWEAVGGATVTGGSVGTATDVTVVVPAGGIADGAKRSLQNSIDEKVAWLVASGAAADVIPVYWYMRSNTGEPTNGGPWEDEDIFNWEQHHYLEITLDAPTGVDSNDYLEVNLTYRTFTVSDNHKGDATRASSFSLEWSEPLTASYAPIIGGSGERSVHVCLSKSGDAWYPDLMCVTDIEILFPVAGTWTIKDVSLVLDVDGDEYHDAPSTHLRAKFAEDPRFERSGGVSGVVDGKYQYALAVHDDYQVWEKEKVVPLLNATEGASSVTDLYAAWGFLVYLNILTNAGNGWRWGVGSEDWDTWTLDEDAVRISNGYSFWLFDAVSIPISPTSGEFPCAIRAHAWLPAPLIPYRPYGCLKVGGGIQGLVRKGDDFNRSSTVPVQRRPPSGSYTDLSASGIDEHGWTGAGFYPEVYEVEWVEAYGEGEEYVAGHYEATYYEWKVDDATFDQVYRRQWYPGNLTSTPGGCCYYIDPFNRHYRFYVNGSSLWLRWTKGEESWQGAVRVAVGQTDPTDLFISWRGGTIYLSWSTSDMVRHVAYSTDCANFTSLELNAGMTHIRSWAFYDTEFMLGYDDGSWYIQKWNTLTNALAPFSDGSYAIAIAEGGDADGGLWGNAAGWLYADLPSGTSYTRYVSRDQGSTWAEVS